MQLPDGPESEDGAAWIAESLHSRLDGYLAHMQAFVAWRTATLRSAIAAACDSFDGGCPSGTTCISRDCGAQQCYQDSLTSSCGPPRADACGCAIGDGWSKAADGCVPGGTTSGKEAATCNSHGGGAKPAKG